MLNKNRLYKTRVQRFNTGKIKIRQYKTPMLIPERKVVEDTPVKKTSKKEIKQIDKSSLSRTRQNIEDMIEHNEDVFKSFITLTYKDEVEDIDKAYKDLKIYIMSCKRRLKKEYDKELYYLGVPEIQQKRAKRTGKYVIHFHILTNMEIDTLLIPKRQPLKTNGYVIEYYDLPYWNGGFSFAKEIVREGTFSLSKYLIKYLYKDFDDRFFGRQKILHSNNIKKPPINYYLEDINQNKLIINDDKIELIEFYRYSGFNEIAPFTEYVYKKGN